MAKGLRLKFLGISATREEIRAMSSAMGYNESPSWNGWGRGGYRNFLGLNKSGKLYETCQSLVSKGLMYSEEGPKFSSDGIVFHVSELGKRFFQMFRRNHPHARLRNDNITRK